MNPIRNTTRAGGALPPAFAWTLLALALAGGAVPRAESAGVPAGAGAFPLGRRAAGAATADSARWGWGLRAPAPARAPAADSAARPPAGAGGAGAARTAPSDSVARPAAADTAGRAGAASGAASHPAPADSAARARGAAADTLFRGAPWAADTTRRSFEYLWVARTAILSPEAVDSVVARAVERDVRGLLVQVVARGDAYYRSDLLPRSEALPHDDFDPLARILARAHAAGLEVHAWMNCMLVWSAPEPPRDPHHVVRAHPEWIARLRDGRRLSQLTPRQRERLGLEGVFLAPAHPGVRRWLAEVAREIVTRYSVDGLQLDYIRQPAVAIGWDPTTRARFALEAGVDPARFDRVRRSERRRVDSLWSEFQSRQVGAAVAEVRDSVRAARPGLAISAAVIADSVTAERNDAQRWREWLRAGLIDRAFVMCYAEPVQTVMDQLVVYRADFGPDGRVVPGIAVYNTPPATAAAKIRGARALGFPALAVYSYDALEERPGYWARLLDSLAGAP